HGSAATVGRLGLLLFETVERRLVGPPPAPQQGRSAKGRQNYQAYDSGSRPHHEALPEFAHDCSCLVKAEFLSTPYSTGTSNWDSRCNRRPATVRASSIVAPARMKLATRPPSSARRLRAGRSRNFGPAPSGDQ